MKIQVQIIFFIALILSGCQAKPKPTQNISEAIYRPIHSLPTNDSDFLLSKEELENKYPDLMFYTNRSRHPEDKLYKRIMCVPESILKDAWGEPNKIVSMKPYFILISLMESFSEAMGPVGVLFLFAAVNIDGHTEIWEKGNYYITAEYYDGSGCNNNPSYTHVYLTEKNKY